MQICPQLHWLKMVHAILMTPDGKKEVVHWPHDATPLEMQLRACRAFSFDRRTYEAVFTLAGSVLESDALPFLFSKTEERYIVDVSFEDRGSDEMVYYVYADPADDSSGLSTPKEIAREIDRLDVMA